MVNRYFVQAYIEIGPGDFLPGIEHGLGSSERVEVRCSGFYAPRYLGRCVDGAPNEGGGYVEELEVFDFGHSILSKLKPDSVSRIVRDLISGWERKCLDDRIRLGSSEDFLPGA